MTRCSGGDGGVDGGDDDDDDGDDVPLDDDGDGVDFPLREEFPSSCPRRALSLGVLRPAEAAVTLHDVKSAAQAKPRDGGISGAEGSPADISEMRPCDSTEEVSTRNWGRLRKRTPAASVAATAEVRVPGAELSNAEGGAMLPLCRRSKRLQRKPSIGRESEDDVTVNSGDDDDYSSLQQRPKRLRHRVGTTIRPYDNDGDSDTADDDDHIPHRRRSKRLRHRVGTRNHSSDDNADSDSLDNHRKPIPRRMSKRLIEKQKVDHVSDVPLDWLQVFDRVRVQSYMKNISLLEEVYTEDERKPEWFEVDRAIACRQKYDIDGPCDILATFQNNKDFDGYEFLVKWNDLDYGECTWEPYCTEGVPSAVSMLIERHQNTLKRVARVSETCMDGKLPDKVHNGVLYGYQLQGLQWIFQNFITRRSVILADEMGLGKTVQVVCFLRQIIKGSFTTSPSLVIAPKSILLQWKKEFGRWASDLNIVIYQGEKDSRKCIQAHEMYSSEGKTLFDALVTSYEFVQLDKAVLQKIKWSTIVVDEAHRLKNLYCNLASCLKRYSSEFRLLLTGTPLQNSILELFSLLHYIDPDEFSDPKTDGLFLPIESGLDLTMDEKVARIHDILKPRMLRRMKSDVLKDSMPMKKWVEVPCALTDSQRDLYINIFEKNYSKLNRDIQCGKKISLNNVLMELRKCCNHPYLILGQEVNQLAGEDVFLSLVSASGKLQLLQKLLPKLKERGNRVLIFSQMTKMLDILEDFLFSLGYKYARIDGQTSLSARQERIKEYNNVESETFIFLMSTRAGGLGIDLPGADRVIIYDPDFNPFMDLQAQSRAHRIGQTRPVVVYQLITKCSVEEKILQKSKQKLAIENMLMNSSKKPSAEELKSVLLHGAKTILEKKKINATSIHYDDEAIENLLKLDPSSGEKCSSDDNGYLGSIVSFAHGDEEEGPLSPKAEDLKVFKPATPKVVLGRGKRQRNAVKYHEESGNEESDDMYAPDASSESSSSSSDDDETEQEVPEVVSLKPEVAPVPDSQLAPSSGGEKENVKLE
ncbi:hypothetical protein QYE76_056810 [Lolium multiflorum]|uniref:Uncharacterized protein n=1 Tax=Lolium multiflorum TaxID=4521 RepID=A0AAD8WNH4_LOLMU|nr:hypothetical protein QYE76_056810 [Lolium multiflorum]